MSSARMTTTFGGRSAACAAAARSRPHRIGRAGLMDATQGILPGRLDSPPSFPRSAWERGGWFLPLATLLERQHVAILFEPLVDLLAVGLLQAVEAEALDGQTGDDGAVGHRAAEAARRRAVVGGEGADDPARETVAGAGRVDHLFRRVGGHDEDAVVAEEHGAVFALLDDDELRPEAAHRLAGLDKVILVGQEARLAVVEQQAVEARQQGQQVVALRLDP